MSTLLQPNVTRAEQLCAEYFPRHIAEYHRADVGGVTVERLVWRTPGTNINRVDYLCEGGRLFVVGDLGEAVYITGAPDLAWWARCDLSYFAGKCEASEYGRGYKSWDDDECRRRVNEQVEQYRADGAEVDEEALAIALDAIGDGQGAWDAWMREGAAALFGDDWWDFVPRYGIRPDQRCALHLYGLKAAMRQVAARQLQLVMAVAR